MNDGTTGLMCQDLQDPSVRQIILFICLLIKLNHPAGHSLGSAGLRRI